MSNKPFRTMVFVRAAVLMAVGVCTAMGDSISASLFSAVVPAGGTLVPISLSGITTPSQNSLTGPGYSITFSSVALNEGVVQGTINPGHAVPVAGISGSLPEYLTGDYGSPLTTNIADAGNYLSTGLAGVITITFTNPQDSLALLWGSIDFGNSLTFNDAANTTFTGAEVETAAAGFVANGFQGPGGSAYVVIDTATPFTTVTATSNVISLELAGVVASNVPLDPVPEPSGTALTGLGITIGILTLRHRKIRSAETPATSA